MSLPTICNLVSRLRLDVQFDRGYISPYFVTDPEKMTVEFDNCKVRELCHLASREWFPKPQGIIFKSRTDSECDTTSKFFC